MPNDTDPARPAPDDVRRPDGSWSVFPLVLSALVLGIAGFLLFGDSIGGPNRPSLTDTTPNTPVAK